MTSEIDLSFYPYLSEQSRWPGDPFRELELPSADTDAGEAL